MARPHKISLCNCQRLGPRNEEGVNDRDQFVFCMKRFPAATPPAPATQFLFLPLRRIVLRRTFYPLRASAANRTQTRHRFANVPPLIVQRLHLPVFVTNRQFGGNVSTQPRRFQTTPQRRIIHVWKKKI